MVVNSLEIRPVNFVNSTYGETYIDRIYNIYYKGEKEETHESPSEHREERESLIS